MERGVERKKKHLERMDWGVGRGWDVGRGKGEGVWKGGGVWGQTWADIEKGVWNWEWGRNRRESIVAGRVRGCKKRKRKDEEGIEGEVGKKENEGMV